MSAGRDAVHRRAVARAAVAAGLVTAPLLLCATPASAASEAELVVDASAWSWRRLAPAPLPEPSNVPAGALAVAFDGQPGTASKATYLRLALGDLPTGTTLSQLSLVVPVDAAASDDPTASPVVVCRLTADFPTGEGLDPATMPAADCQGAPAARYDEATSSLVVDLTAAGTAWLAGAANHGVVLRPPVDAAVPGVLPYELVLGGATSVVGRATVTLPVRGGVTGPPPVEPAPLPPIAPFVPFEPTAALPPLLPGPVVMVPPVGPAPAVGAAPTSAPTAVVAPVAGRRPIAAARASVSGFAMALLGGLVLLVLAGWSLGDTTGLRAYTRAERARRDRLRRGALVVPVAGPAPARQRVGRRHTRQGRSPLSSAASTLT